MKKILFLEQYGKLSGGQKVLLSIIDGLKADYEFSVILPETGALTEELDKRGIAYQQLPVGYYSLGKKNPLDFFNYIVRLPYLILKLCVIIDKEKPDLIYANAARTFVFATIAAVIKKVPLIWHVHSIFDRGISKKLCNLFGRNKIVKKVIAVSDAVRLPLIDLWPKTQIIYNAINEDVYHPGKRLGPIRKSFNISDEIVISMVGLLVEWKCVDDFIRAAQIVVESHPNSKFLIVGDALYDEKGKKYKKYLEGLVKEAGLEKNVIFTGFRNDVPDIMRELDIFVIASKTPDPCPTSLLQAMASGPAPIATNFGGPAEIIKDNQDGLLYNACDYHQLAEKILWLIENKEKRLQIAKESQEKIKRHFNYKDYIVRLKEIIYDVLQNEDMYKSGEYLKNNPTWHREDAPWKVKKIIEILDEAFLQKLVPEVDIVDIGCGTGDILHGVCRYLKKENVKAVFSGFDLSDKVINSAKENFPEANFFCSGFDAKMLQGEKRGSRIALLIDILEHLEDPNELLGQIRRTCDYAVCHLPLEDNFEVNHRGLKDYFTKTVGHLHFYNKESAIDLFENNGFEVEKLIYTCSDVSADYKLKSLPRRLIAQPVRRLFFKISPDFTAKVLGNCSLMILIKPQKG